MRDVEEVLVVEAPGVAASEGAWGRLHEPDEVEQREQRRLLRRELGHAVGHARRHLREVEEEGEEGHGVGRGGQQVLQQEAHLVVERHQQELEPARRRRVVAASAGQDRLPGVPAGAGGNESAAAEQRQEPVVVGMQLVALD